ncbi:NUDIX domain-containing protein [Fusibacter paucivorans]|uniref:NUDIX domain-containing protein n=1 Tax=Fusibacter paucivorans TaxID=76009 RepID=A0ABS5PW49_9FIRM|nr:NUDIX domain-containing protein [Fusibacter paucivorans]MBS7528846.1 NUDIX domain-containing protein [Fusibacter paucivorans]
MGKVFQLCGASIILYRNNEVLLQKRTDNQCWGYHGGAIEVGEIVEDAAKRELFEETGLTANRIELYGVFSGPDQYHVYLAIIKYMKWQLKIQLPDNDFTWLMHTAFCSSLC